MHRTWQIRIRLFEKAGRQARLFDSGSNEKGNKLFHREAISEHVDLITDGRARETAERDFENEEDGTRAIGKRDSRCIFGYTLKIAKNFSLREEKVFEISAAAFLI